MMVRHYEIDFNSGALVFPGGSVDKGDQEIVATPELYSGGEGLDVAALELPDRRDPRDVRGKRHPAGAAARIEDAGRCEAGRRDRGGASRRPVRGQDDVLQGFLPTTGMVLALDELVPYAHWITPEGMPKRFDTWFFLAAAPPEQVGAHDGKESTDSIWVSPREALAGGESGRFKLPFPTTRNLIKLGKQPEREGGARRFQGQEPIVTVMPVMTRLNGGRQLRIPRGGRLRRRSVRSRRGVMLVCGMIHNSTCNEVSTVPVAM